MRTICDILVTPSIGSICNMHDIRNRHEELHLFIFATIYNNVRNVLAGKYVHDASLKYMKLKLNILFIYLSSESCWAEFKNKFPTIYLFDWLIWPPSQGINFLYVPSQYRFLSQTSSDLLIYSKLLQGFVCQWGHCTVGCLLVLHQT